MTYDAVVSIFVSAVVATVVAFILKYIFENRQEHRHEVELERMRFDLEQRFEQLRSSLAVSADVLHRAAEKRMECYPRIVELAYRCRNLTRELASHQHNPVLADEYSARSSEFAECIYAARACLEGDGIFEVVHAYKNLLLSVRDTLREVGFLMHSNEGQSALATTSDDLRKLAAKVEQAHRPVIAALSRKIVPSQAGDDSEHHR